MNISIILGTLNRRNFIPGLIENTVTAHPDLELVIADGGSNDGTVEYIKRLNHPQIKLIEIGHPSPCPHFINTCIKESSYELVCQWTDDSYMIQPWSYVMEQIDLEYDFFIFTWKWGELYNIPEAGWLDCKNRSSNNQNGWMMFTKEYNGDLVLGRGIYKKQIFRDIGMFYKGYEFWCSDGDMSERADAWGYKHKLLDNIQVLVFGNGATRTCLAQDQSMYTKCRELYKEKKLPDGIEYLRDRIEVKIVDG